MNTVNTSRGMSILEPADNCYGCMFHSGTSECQALPQDPPCDTQHKFVKIELEVLDGRKYAAIVDNSPRGCDGCDFRGEAQCAKMEGRCDEASREDGRSVIWKLLET